ncbi:hypothetical protein CYLTODRAFT_421834 [Cylindrobasidium torrendii FP15055 ss-10]|uniref:Uncharacterized protein n=1 Tax=Cylindrobasidium torrendii FP15055 ss-10 TaxID=1314674 RepID=A0A0D7BDB4_9AGAR|nr:hypothetical protein CYLTODRAFT_421834 [Cylindrobasidium torrendii FP15055 ss-10]
MANPLELPAELLCKIFLLAQVHVAAEFVDLNLVEENARLAVTVSQVCQHWRSAALGFAGLWVYIPYQHQHHKRIPQIKEYIERSSGQPLTLSLLLSDEVPAAPEVTPSTFDSLGQSSESSSERIPEIDMLLQQHLEQAEYICIEEPQPRASVVVLYAHKPPCLKSLSLRCRSTSLDEHEYSILLPATSYKPFTSLEYLHLDGILSHPESVALASNLDNLSLHTFRFPLHNTLIPSASTLTTLTPGPRVLTLVEGPFRQVVFSALKTLTLVNNPHFMKWLDTPNLHTLNMRSFTYSNFVRALTTLIIPQETTMPKVEVLFVQLIENNDRDPMMIGHPWITPDVWMSGLCVALPKVITVHWDVHSTRIHVLQTWAGMLAKYGTRWAELREVIVNSEDAQKAVLRALQGSRKDLAGAIKIQ